MPAATQILTSFLGGEISQYAQGRYDRPDYRTSMRVCFNSMPLESGAWTRRPGTQYSGHTRGGTPGRVIKFDFQQSAPITMEFTDNYVRFRNGAVLITTNDDQTIVSISTANPAVVQTLGAVAWATGDTAIFPVASIPQLENRQVVLTKIDTTHFSIADALTGLSIDGSTFGALATGAYIARVLEVQTGYAGSTWENLRVIQAETTGIFLAPASAPQVLTATIYPYVNFKPSFALSPAVFLDGPYLDPFTNGAQATPSAAKGIITLTVSFSAYDASKAYKLGDFVTSAGVNYKSLIDQNVGNTPVSSPTAWQATSAGAAINNGQGFLGTDVGRLVRLLSEPAPWVAATAYTTGNVVSYNPSGDPGATTYWQAIAATTGHAPGSDIIHWSLLTQNAAIWTWGKITSLTNIISPTLVGSVNIGDMTLGGGINSVFDSVFTKASSASAGKQDFQSGGFFPPSTRIGLSSYVGKNYSGASAQAIQQATVYPTSNFGFGAGVCTTGGVQGPMSSPTFTFNLRGKSTAPTSASDGTLLGTSGAVFNPTSPVTVISSDTATTWNYVWIEQIGSYPIGGVLNASAYQIISLISQVSFFTPTGTGTSSGAFVEILGPALLYPSVSIATWRLGAYSNTTGWPTCGCYDGGRLFLSGAIPNRWDACVSNGITGNSINFAPTNQYGAVATSNAISYTFNSDSVNPIFWMSPELQGVIMGTLAGEWLVQAPTNGPISPTNVAARRVTKIGCANIEPRRTEHTTIFVKRYGRKLMEYFADVYSGKYSAPNLADKAQHITSPGVAELAYTEAVNPVLWGRDADGGLFGVTYKRDSLTSAQGPTFYGWHPHALGSGRTVESICSGPSADGSLDTLAMVTNDASSAVRHVEILTDTPDELTEFASCWFLDDAVNPTSVVDNNVSMTFNGLWHLNGQTVQIFAGGLDLGDPGEGKSFADFVIANGSVTVSYGDSISSGPGRGLFTRTFARALSLSQIVIGFTYNSDGQAVRLIAQADTGARNGPALGAPSRSHRAALKLVNAKGLSIGGNFDRLYPCLFKAGIDSTLDLPALSLYTGIFFDQLRDDFTYDDSLCWRVSRPFPATITAAGINLRTEDM